MQKEIFVATDLDHSNLFVTTIRMLMLIVTNQASNSYTKSKKRIVLVMPSTVWKVLRNKWGKYLICSEHWEILFAEESSKQHLGQQE